MAHASLLEFEGLDVEALKALLISERSSHAAEIKQQRNSHIGEIERLRLLIEKLRRMLFGTKSEKMLRQIDQLELQLEELQTGRATKALSIQTQQEDHTTAKPSRRPLPEHLPREIYTHDPEHDFCPDCGGALRHLGEDSSEILEYVRASFKVICHVRPKRSCAACELRD